METREQVRQFVLTNFYVADPASLDDDASLLEAGIVDSTGVLEIISFLENEVGVTVDDEDMVPENLDAVTHITAFIEKKRTKAA